MNLARARRMVDPFVERVPTLAVLALLVLAGWLAARWVLYFAAPVEAPTAPVRERVQLGVTAQALSDAHLFGVAPAGAGGEAVSDLKIKLRGVFAGGGNPPSIVIVNTGDRDETARIGREIVPGVILEAVHPRHVMLRRNGALERVNLEEPQAVAAAPAPRAPPRRAQVSGPAPQPGPAVRLQRPEPSAPVGEVATEPAAVAAPAPPQAPPPALVTAPGAPATLDAPGAQGLMIQNVPAGSLLERFGLQAGDVVRSVNGEVVASEADVARILQSRGLQGPFTVEVQRGEVTVPISVNAQR